MTNKWSQIKITELYDSPFLPLVAEAYRIHQQYFKTQEMELCRLMSIKTGACPEDCAYCPQSGHYHTSLQREKLSDLATVVAQAKLAKQHGATRFCMGAAWRRPPRKDLPAVLEMIKAVKQEGLEACVTLGMLNLEEAQQLKAAGLDFYNHNLDTSRDYYATIIATRTYQDRLDTLQYVREAGIRVCCGGIIGMGETRQDRVALLAELVNLPELPASVPINRLIAIPGTPLADTAPLDNFEFIRTIAVARIIMPKSMLRLSAGRDTMSEEMQAFCFMAGANSIFFGDKLLTAKNPAADLDLKFLAKLGIIAKQQPTELEKHL